MRGNAVASSFEEFFLIALRTKRFLSDSFANLLDETRKNLRCGFPSAATPFANIHRSAENCIKYSGLMVSCASIISIHMIEYSIAQIL